MLKLRLITGLTLTAVIIAVMVLDGWLSSRPAPAWLVPGLGVNIGRWLLNGVLATALTAFFGWIAADELVNFAELRGFRPGRLLVKLGVLGLVIGPYVVFNAFRTAASPGESWSTLVLVLALGLAFLLQAVRFRTQQVIANLGATLLILVYVGGFGHFIVRLRMEIGGPAGVALLLFTLFVVKMTDTGAYFAGRAFGRARLIEWLSPKKTWAGLFGGFVTAAVIAVGVGSWLFRTDWFETVYVRTPPGWLLLVFGLVMAVLAVAGDLAASLLKRDAAVKDSGGLPGLGGAVDVLDSPLMAAPGAWFFWVHVMRAFG